MVRAEELTDELIEMLIQSAPKTQEEKIDGIFDMYFGGRGDEIATFCVAVRGDWGPDWTAYMMSFGWPLNGNTDRLEAAVWASQRGHKLPQRVAEAMFPDSARRYVWRA